MGSCACTFIVPIFSRHAMRKVSSAMWRVSSVTNIVRIIITGRLVIFANTWFSLCYSYTCDTTSEFNLATLRIIGRYVHVPSLRLAFSVSGLDLNYLLPRGWALVLVSSNIFNIFKTADPWMVGID